MGMIYLTVTYRNICIGTQQYTSIPGKWWFYLEPPVKDPCDIWTKFKYPTWIYSQAAQREPRSRPESAFRH